MGAKTPEGGWAAEDLGRIPGLPPHVELLDGSLVYRSPQTYFHMVTVRLLQCELLNSRPPHLAVLSSMTVTLGMRDRPEPDVMAVRREAVEGMDQTDFRREDVVLAVEVVSPESVERDREVKPRKYAKAGIRHYWRVENENGELAVHVFELEDATGSYAPQGIFRRQLKLDLPFSIDIDLTNPARWL